MRHLRRGRHRRAPRPGHGPEPVYLVEFPEFWDWLSDVRLRPAEAGWTVKAYCWHEGAENREMRRITASDEAWGSKVAAFIGSDEWVDMERVSKAGWITGEGTSLKAIAPLAEHVWEVDDRGGGLSMMHLAEATSADGPEAEEAQAWLKAYKPKRRRSDSGDTGVADPPRLTTPA